MTYEEALRYLLALGSELAAPRQPVPKGFEGAKAVKFDLHNITVLADRLDSPHRASPCAHIAGTNVKGSTAAMLDSILRHAGLVTCLYTSPHLERINERIRIQGEEIADSAFAEAFTRVHAFIEVMLASGTLAAHPTYFECLTAMAFDAFARARVDFTVYEVGMGGRLDSTNIVTPEVAVITQIDFDHENYLGHSIHEIAVEKAGIIKPGARVVSSAERPEARAVIRRKCKEMEASLIEIDVSYRVSDTVVGATLGSPAGGASPAPTRVSVRDLHCNWQLELTIPLLGRYQVRNAVAAVAAARVLAAHGFAISNSALREGIANVRWPGRLELLQRDPLVYLDGTHNPAGARELLAFWHEQFPGRNIHLLYGAVRDKAVDEITGLLFPHAARVTLTQPNQPRAISASVLREMTSHHGVATEIIANPGVALERAIARAAPEDVVFVTGSLYLVGDLRRWWKSRRQPRATERTA